jgi:hypothetical protein
LFLIFFFIFSVLDVLFFYRVIDFAGYLEIIVILEEHFNGYKPLTSHKLFASSSFQQSTAVKTKRFLPRMLCLFSIFFCLF